MLACEMDRIEIVLGSGSIDQAFKISKFQASRLEPVQLSLLVSCYSCGQSNSTKKSKS